MKIVEVHWLDSARGNSHWEDEIVTDIEDMKCSSVGYLFKETDDFIALVSHIGTERKDYLYTLQIPKGAITSIQVIADTLVTGEIPKDTGGKIEPTE